MVSNTKERDEGPMMSKQLYQRIKQLPKVDLHVHLDGSVQAETVIELAKNQGLSIPATSTKALSPHLSVGSNCDSLTDYLQKFELVSMVLQTKEALERVAYELVSQARDENYKYMEVRFAPQQHRANGLTVSEVIEAVIKGLTKGECVFGVHARLIACCMRHHDMKTNQELVQTASLYLNRGLVAVDLAGDEKNYPNYLFKKVFDLANHLEIPITIHAGEASGAESIKTAVEDLGASRIGHGVRLIEDMELLEYMKHRSIPLEMCPISNLQTKATKDWLHYPIRYYFDQGLQITVHTDNITVSQTSMSKEFAVLMEQFHFTITELNQLTMNAVDASFLSYQEKEFIKQTCLLEMKKGNPNMSMVV